MRAASEQLRNESYSRMYRRKSVGKVNCRETETQGGSRVYRGEAVELESQLPGPGMVETQTDDGGEGQHEQ